MFNTISSRNNLKYKFEIKKEKQKAYNRNSLLFCRLLVNKLEIARANFEKCHASADTSYRTNGRTWRHYRTYHRPHQNGSQAQ